MMIFKKYKKGGGQGFDGGFTLLETLVAISIMTVVSLVVVTSQQSFNNSVHLTNTAYEMALSIRQAQSYGSSVRYYGGSANPFDTGYGIHFSPAAAGEDYSRKFILFADADGDERYDGSDVGGSCVGECVSIFSLSSQNFISRFCGKNSSNELQECYQFTSPQGGDITGLDIMFFRPHLSACFRTNLNPRLSGSQKCSNNLRYSSATIYLQSRGGGKRQVVILGSGQIDVQ